MEGTGKPEYDKCVAISTKAAIREMVLPGALALLVPIIIGFGLKGVFKDTSSAEILGGVLAGVTVSGVLMAIFQSNAGGAWDNAKKSFEKGIMINGKMEYKGSDAHKASVTGDTVGDPFKDTSGPSMNILIKLMSIVSLVIAPHIAVQTIAVEEVHKQKTEEVITSVSQDITPVKGIFIFSKSHTWVGFTLKHFLSTARGTISVDTGSFNLTGDLKTSSVDLVLSVKSINTNNTNRDEKLASDEYFDAAKFPIVKFHASSIDTSSSNKQFKYVAKGDLTIKDVTKHVELPFNYVGEFKNDPRPSIFTFEGEYTINRLEYHIGKESKMASNDVKVTYSIEASAPKK
jgi:polyisoprenoid-binding protein YceI